MTVGIALQLPEVFLARELLLPTISSQNISLLCLLSQEVIAASRVLSCCEDGSTAKGVKGRGRCLTPDLATNHRALKIFPGRKVSGSLMLCLVLSWHSCWPGAFGGPLALSLSRIYDVRYMVSSGVSQCQSLRRWSPPYLSSCGIINPIFCLLHSIFFAFGIQGTISSHTQASAVLRHCCCWRQAVRGALRKGCSSGCATAGQQRVRCARVTGDPSPLRTVTQVQCKPREFKKSKPKRNRNPKHVNLHCA